MSGLGRFITLEGVDGSGKSTQALMLAEALERRGLRVIRTREPGGTDLGEGLRALLLSTAPDRIGAVAEMHLFAAARAQLVSDVIAPALRAGTWVVADRFIDSSLAYQGAGRGLGITEVLLANQQAVEGFMPTRTLLLELPGDLADARRGAGGDRIEREGPAFRQRVETGYHDLVERFPVRIRVVDADGSPDDVHARVMEHITPLLPPTG